MGIVHAAIYDAAVAIEGGYRPYAIAPTAPADTSPEAAIATAAHDTLTGLQPQLGADQSDSRRRLRRLPGRDPGRPRRRTNGIAVGRAGRRSRARAARERRPWSSTRRSRTSVRPRAGPGVWQPAPGAVLGLCLPGMRPLALRSASQFRPDGPNALTSQEYADDLNQVEQLGRIDSTTRTRRPDDPGALLDRPRHPAVERRHAPSRRSDRGLDLVQTARMLAMAHVAGGDAMIACFDAKYHYWFWRPYQAIPQADTDGNPATVADPTWRPLGATPNFPEYPSAHACHSTAVVEALDAFFGTDKVPFTLDSRVTSRPAAPLRPPAGHRQGRRLGTRPRRLPLPQLRPGRLRPRAQGRPLRRR